MVVGVVGIGQAAVVAPVGLVPRAEAEPGSRQRLLLAEEELPEGYRSKPQPLDDALGALTAVRGWMFGSGARIDPPACTAELGWFVSNLLPGDSAAATESSPRVLVVDGVGGGGRELEDFDSHIDACKEVRTTSGAVAVDVALAQQLVPKTEAEAARGFKETVTFELGGFRQTREVFGFYGSVGAEAALVVGGSRDLGPASASPEEALAAVGDVYARQIAKIDKSRPRK